MQLAREEDDGGGDALKDCFAKDLCICTYLVGFFFFFLIFGSNHMVYTTLYS